MVKHRAGHLQAVLLALSLLLAQTPQHMLFRQPNLPREAGAFFEAFSSSGAGTFGACSTTPPTGAKGEVLTFTRASTATCTKTASGGLATAGIANGDLVSMSSNVARVEYDSAGTLGLLVEASRTNSLLRSESIDNAAWTKGPAIGTITADFATAPDGTLTADRYQYTNNNNDYVLQSFSVGGVAASTSLYLRGTSGAGTLNMCRGGAVGQCVTCSYVSTSWTRCRYEATLTTATNVFIGCETSTLGGACAQTGLDVLVWGFQGELGAYATSYIPTAGATATRVTETASFAAAWPTSASISMAGNVVSPSFQSGTAATTAEFNGLSSLYNESGGLIRWYNGTGLTVAISSASAGLRWYGYHTGTSRGMGWGATTTTGADADADNKFAATLFVGGSGGNRPDGILSRLCVDSNSERCR